MNDIDTHDPLHSVVRSALLDDAEHAPELRAEWTGAALVSAADISKTSFGWQRALVAVAAAAALIVGLAVAARPGSEAPASAPTPWLPEGTEFPSVDLGPATEVPNGPAVQDLTRSIGIDGHPPQVVATSLQYLGNDTAVVSTCTSELGSSGCRPEWNPSTWSTSVTSSVDNGYADFDLWTIEGLPAEAAFVTYVDGDFELWQRPIRGFAAFPNVEGRSEVAVAYDANGKELERFTADRQPGSIGQAPPLADLSDDDLNRLGKLTDDEMRTCLLANGAVVNEGDVAMFVEQVDQIAIWNQCVGAVKDTVRDAVTVTASRFDDPSSD